MQARFQEVYGRAEANEASYASTADWVLAPAESTSAQRVFEEQGWSPYCIDLDRAELVFTRLPAETNLAATPFYSLTQYLQADAILRVSLSDVEVLAAELADPSTSLIFSMGRCGSTLVSHALTASGRVWSISEPAVFDHRQLRALADRGNVSGLINAMVRLLHASRTVDVPSLALKFRSQTLFIAELFWNALPEAKYVFMYRDALGWGESFFQFLIDIGVPMPFDEAGRSFFWMMNSADKPLDVLGRFVDLEHRPISSERVLAAGWIIHVEEYLRLLGRGVPFLGMRYNELVANPDGELTRLFAHCGIPLSSVGPALHAFEEDSQKGTAIARKGAKRKFDEMGVRAFLATLANVPTLADPMVELPDGTHSDE